MKWAARYRARLRAAIRAALGAWQQVASDQERGVRRLRWEILISEECLADAYRAPLASQVAQNAYATVRQAVLSA